MWPQCVATAMCELYPVATEWIIHSNVAKKTVVFCLNKCNVKMSHSDVFAKINLHIFTRAVILHPIGAQTHMNRAAFVHILKTTKKCLQSFCRNIFTGATENLQAPKSLKDAWHRRWFSDILFQNLQRFLAKFGRKKINKICQTNINIFTLNQKIGFPWKSKMACI